MNDNDTALTVTIAKELRTAVPQLVGLVATLERRLQEQQEQTARMITITHKQYKAVMAAIRRRSEELAEEYHLAQTAALRTALRKEILAEYAVEELHDLPLRSLDEALEIIRNWKRYTVIRKIKAKEAAGVSHIHG